MLKKVLMLGVIGIMTMGVPSIVCGGVDNTEASETTEQSKEYLHLKVEDAFDLVPLLGEDLKNLNIPQEAIQYIGSHPFAIHYDGNLLKQPCNEIFLGFSHDFNNKIDSVSCIYITCTKPDFLFCKAYLDKKLGECHSCGSLPYAAVNGGALTFFIYYKDGYKYDLSMGSARNYYMLRITKEEPKTPPKRESIYLAIGSRGCVGPLMPGMPMGMMGMQNQPASSTATKEAWFCTKCGYKNTGKYCGECGTKKPGTDAKASQPESSKDIKPRSEITMTDGPGMMNENYWKHEVLDGGWMAPTSDLALNIKGFDYEFGIYKPGESDNFRWTKGRFYFAGWQNSPKREERYDLLLTGEPTIIDAEGKTLVSIKEMWHEKNSIFMRLQYPGEENFVIKELRKPKDIVE